MTTLRMKIDGKQIAQDILDNLKKQIEKLKMGNIYPKLAIILVGNDPASIAYVKQKILTAKKIGIKTSLFQYTNSISTKDLLGHLNDLNHLSTVHGIIVQQPLPQDINLEKIIKTIDPKKDVDGFHPNSHFQMPIVMAVLQILEEIRQACHLRGGVAPAAHHEGKFNRWLASKKIVIIGKGETGGKPVMQGLKKMGAEPLIVDSKTPNPLFLTKNADIIISAVGKPNIITSDKIKKKVILISIGLFKDEDGKLQGDYEEDEIKNKALFYTSTPGGVGPVNVAMLLKNLVYAASQETTLVLQSGT